MLAGRCKVKQVNALLLLTLGYVGLFPSTQLQPAVIAKAHLVSSTTIHTIFTKAKPSSISSLVFSHRDVQVLSPAYKFSYDSWSSG
jgi:hypothetical protein